MPRLRYRRAPVRQHESAGAIGRFGVAGRKAALADRRRLLVARKPGYGNGRAEQLGQGRAKRSGIVGHFAQSARRHAEQIAQAGIELRDRQRQQAGAAGVAGVADLQSAGQLRDKPALHRAQRQPATCRRLGHRRGIVDQPAHLCRGEIGIEQQPGLRLHRRLLPRLAQRGAGIGGAPVLPDQRAVQRFERLPVPGDHGFALVGDADTGDPVRAAGLRDDILGAGERRLPDFVRIVFDPARLGIVLGKLPLRQCAQAASPVENHGAGRGGARVEHENKFAWRVHEVLPHPLCRSCRAKSRHLAQQLGLAEASHTSISPSMEFPPKPWPVARAEQTEPLVRRVLVDNPSAFTFTGTQTYLVGSEGEVAVIDPGPDEPEHIAALVRIIGDARLVAIACTHTHRDHSPAAAPLAAATGAPIIGCAPLSLTDDGPRADAAFDPSYAPERVLGDGDALSGKGWTLTAVATPGHTSNHLCYALEESGALFTGDHVMGWSTTVIAPPDGDMADYMASLHKLQDREDRVYYPAHGPAVTKPRQLVRGMIGHRRQRESQILRLIGEGTGAIEDMVPQMYKGVDERMWPAAGRSVLAHLIDLERKGRVARDGELWTAAA